MLLLILMPCCCTGIAVASCFSHGSRRTTSIGQQGRQHPLMPHFFVCSCAHPLPLAGLQERLVDIIFCNEQEAQALCQVGPASIVSKQLLGRKPLVACSC